MEEKIINLLYEESKPSADEANSDEDGGGDEGRLSRSSSSQASVSDYEDALDLATERFRLMKRLGFKVASLMDACAMIVDIAYDIPDYRTARLHCKEGLHLARTLYGRASDEYRQWEERESLVRQYQSLAKSMSSLQRSQDK